MAKIETVEQFNKELKEQLEEKHKTINDLDWFIHISKLALDVLRNSSIRNLIHFTKNEYRTKKISHRPYSYLLSSKIMKVANHNFYKKERVYPKVLLSTDVKMFLRNKVNLAIHWDGDTLESFQHKRSEDIYKHNAVQEIGTFKRSCFTTEEFLGLLVFLFEDEKNADLILNKEDHNIFYVKGRWKDYGPWRDGWWFLCIRYISSGKDNPAYWDICPDLSGTRYPLSDGDIFFTKKLKQKDQLIDLTSNKKFT